MSGKFNTKELAVQTKQGDNYYHFLLDPNYKAIVYCTFSVNNLKLL